jgi:hypothetical protein
VNPVQSSGARTSSWGRPRATAASCRQTSIGFSCAPSGTTPVSRYRHSAINNLRASATIAAAQAVGWSGRAGDDGISSGAARDCLRRGRPSHKDRRPKRCGSRTLLFTLKVSALDLGAFQRATSTAGVRRPGAACHHRRPYCRTGYLETATHRVVDEMGEIGPGGRRAREW